MTQNILHQIFQERLNEMKENKQLDDGELFVKRVALIIAYNHYKNLVREEE